MRTHVDHIHASVFHAIADEFNSHFTNVAAKLVDKLPPFKDFFSADNDCIRDFYERKGVHENSFELLPISEQFVFKELRKLNVSKKYWVRLDSS